MYGQGRPFNGAKRGRGEVADPFPWESDREDLLATMSEAPAKRAKLAVEKANGSSPGGTGAVSSPRRAARAVVDTDAELLEADTAANGDAPAITDAMEAENAKCDTPSHHRTH